VTDRIVLVSSDCHIGPRLVEDLRPYCPARLLDAFDHFVARPDRARGRFAEPPAGAVEGQLSEWRNMFISGHHDMDARRADLDFDGVAAEVIFHGSQNGEPIPFQTSMLGAPDDTELAAAGIRIYNRWLADRCAEAPHRHVGLAHLPMWDVDAAVREVEWARAAGLRGVNFPAPRPWIRRYNDPAWEPLWAACEELAMPLTTHSGAGDQDTLQGPEAMALTSIESGGWFSRRALHLLIFAGVFERHPGLRLVLTEQPGEWWPYTMLELDSAWHANRSSAALQAQVPRPPSEYAATNVFIGASFLSRGEAAAAVNDGYAHRILWGSDYPHMEGTFQQPASEGPGAVCYTRLALRFTFAGLPEDAVRAMCGLTAAEVYGLDLGALRATADAIDAPRFADIDAPLDAAPVGASRFAFRTVGPWA
jgi:predicted TIM-barrel fold metal-dependent hydrolase